MVYTFCMTLPDQQLRKLLTVAIAKAYPQVGEIEIPIEPTTDGRFGDYTSTVAMKLAKQLDEQPRDVAQHLIAQLGTVAPILDKADVAGGGFINFTLKPTWLMKQVDGMAKDATYGASTIGGGKKILLEFVSANPTGPITLGNGRAAFSGDTLANILEFLGWKVVREFYINDAGNQVDILAESVLRRYWQQQGIKTEYPEYCYQGEYVSDLAKKLKLQMYTVQSVSALRDRIKGRVLTMMINDQERVMKKMGVAYDSWFRESTLHKRKLTDKMISYLDRHGLLFHQDGATWFKTTAFGDDKDRVLVKKDGSMTYLVSDVALRWNRFVERKIDREIIYLGADHHGYIGRLQAIAAALGHARAIDVLILQLVRLLKDGQEVKMSKRAGTYVTLEEVVDDVGLDVARFFFLMHSANSHMDFDLNLAKEKSEKNPVYYVQYAHARIASILAKTKKLPVVPSKEQPHTSELNLVKALLHFPRLIEDIGQNFEVHKLSFYAVDLATTFHDFYTHCRVIDHDKVWKHRLQLVTVTKQLLVQTLGLMGVSAPDKM